MDTDHKVDLSFIVDVGHKVDLGHVVDLPTCPHTTATENYWGGREMRKLFSTST